ncbi:MAG: magnesium transporter [Fimbriimonadaceae bacterium]
MTLQEFRKALKSSKLERVRGEIQRLGTWDAIDLIRQMTPSEALVLLRLLGKDTALEVFESLNPSEQAELVESLEPGEVNDMLNQLDPAEVVDVLDELPAKVVKRITKALPSGTMSEVSQLLGYPDGSAGRDLNPRYLAVLEGTIASEALKLVQESVLDAEDLEVVFVIGPSREYRGYVPLATLFRASSGTRIENLLDDSAPAVVATDPIRNVTQMFKKYGFALVPVVDKEHRLLGSIRAEEAIELVDEEAAKRLVQFGGALQTGPDIDLKHSTLTKIYSARVIWLAILTVFGVVTSTFVANQEEMLSAVIVLAAFIAPIVDMGGNTGSQSATLVIRGLALGQFKLNWSGFWFVFKRDLFVAAALAVTIGILEMILAYFSKGIGWDILMVVGITMFAVTILGSLIGVALPFIARRFGADPATLSAPAITSIMDLLGVLIYFAMAGFFLSHYLAQ